jgi:simple sugar transport system ATP-binding protein
MMSMAMNSHPLLEARGVSKHFGAVRALDGVDFTVSPGAVHGVLGKNGAGKSTLMALIAGAIAPTEGRIFLNGSDITHLSLPERKDLGIHLMEQHTEIVPSLGVAENLIFPDYPTKNGLVDWSAVRARAEDLLRRYGFSVPCDQLAGTLSLPDQRKLSLIKTLADKGTLAILDEPTTAMSREERRELFEWIRELTEGGLTFIYITHSTRDVREVCNEYTVLRDGRVAGAEGSVTTASDEGLAKLMTGVDVVEFKRERAAADEPLLRLEQFQVAGVRPVSFSVGRGEVVGLVGLPGSGAREVARALAGLQEIEAGSVYMGDTEVYIRHTADAIDAGIAYLPNDRIGEGLVPQLTVQENLWTGNWPTQQVLGFLDFNRMREGFAKSREEFEIQTSGSEQLINQLSGGNQQKVLLGRLVGTAPRVLVLDEPTAGIDVEAKEDVHRLIDALTMQGLSVLMLAYDPAELIRLVDRVLVFRDCALVHELLVDELTGEDMLFDLVHAHTAESGGD